VHADSIPTASYHFDEGEYHDVAGEIIENIAGLNGQAKSAQPVAGKVCNAIDLIATGTSNYALLDEAILSGKSDFTISLWTKTIKTGNQSFISGATSGSGNELIFWFPSSSQFRPYLNNSQNGTLSTSSIADNQWHHLVWSRTGNQSCLYIDGSLEGCVSQPTGALSIASLVLGQEQDSVGGGFSSSQAADAIIDELMIFDAAISSTEVTQIFTNQNAGLNYDGSARTCPNPPPTIPEPELVANYSFDELEYNDQAGEIIESVAGLNGQAKNSQPSTGKVCNAIDLSASGTSDYAILDSDVLSGKTNFSVSLWTKSLKTGNQSLLSAANSTSNNELLMWFPSHTQFKPFLNNDSDGTISTASISDNQWHHVVWTHASNQSCVFVDKVAHGCVSQPTAAVSIESLVVGQEQDSVGGGFSSSQAAEGLIDELMIFDQALELDDISAIYDNQNAGLNYDGSTRTCEEADSSPIGLYQFEQTNFSSQIDDSSGFDNHGVNISGVPLLEGKYCQAFDSNGTNGGTETKHAFDSMIDLDDDVKLKGTISFWFNSNTAWNKGGYDNGSSNTGERTLFDATQASNTSASNKYFALEILNTGLLRFAFEDESDADFKLNEPSISGASVRSADTWYYITTTWDFTQNSFQLYVDGNAVISQSITTNNQIKDLGNIVFGDNATIYATNNHESLASRTSANGKFDEVRIYKYVLSQAEIQADMDKGADCNLTPYAQWRLDENSWSGSAGEVKDQIGSFHAQAINGATTDSVLPALTGDPGTCGYGEFDGENDYIAVPDHFSLPITNEGYQDSFTITAWIKPTKLKQGSRIFADDENNTKGYAFSLGDPGSGKLRFYSRGVTPISVDTTAAVIDTDVWTFVAAVHNSATKTREIYVNGVAQTVTGGGISNTYTGNWQFDAGIASIGGETNSGETANRFPGNIDEVRIYTSALTSSQLISIKNETHPCTTAIDHFEIDTLAGQGLTCEPSTVTIKACANSSCSQLSTDNVDVELSINGAAQGTITVSGSVNTTVQVTSPSIATLSLDENYQCINGSPTECDITFADTGFRFTTNTPGAVIPTQLSGKPSNIDYNASTITVEAIETNPVSGACQSALIENTVIEMAATCVNPAACASNQVAINNLTTTTAISTVDGSGSLSYSSVNLDFGSSSDNNAEIILTYPDAGQMQLHARYNIPDNNGNPSGNYMLGSSNTFVVKPLGFYIDVAGNPSAETALGTAFIAAGEDFSTTLTAVQWQSDDDDGSYLLSEKGDGIADTDADLSDNAVTANFGQESSPDAVLLYYSQVLPVAGTLGNLANNSFSGFMGGSASNTTINYDEVGIISLSASLNDNQYLGTENVNGYVPYVGRFFPHHFELTLDRAGSLAAVCDGVDADMPFAYVGQVSLNNSAQGVLQYLQQPKISITPQSKQNDHTSNYTGDFNKLTISGITRFQLDDGSGTLVDAPIADQQQLGVDGVNKVKLLSNLFDGVLTEMGGILSYEYSESDNFIYSHEQNSEVIPFVSDIHLSLASVTDSDGVIADDADANGDTGNASDTVFTLGPSSKEVRFSRAVLANSFGPELVNLPLHLTIEYLNPDGIYIVNGLDSCTRFNSGNLALSSGTLNANLSGVNSASGYFNDEQPLGETRAMILTAPGNGNLGTINVEYDIATWLKYDWDWNGVEVKNFNENPTAVATFGLYRGNDRIIYHREITN